MSDEAPAMQSDAAKVWPRPAAGFARAEHILAAAVAAVHDWERWRRELKLGSF